VQETCAQSCLRALQGAQPFGRRTTDNLVAPIDNIEIARLRCREQESGSASCFVRRAQHATQKPDCQARSHSDRMRVNTQTLMRADKNLPRHFASAEQRSSCALVLRWPPAIRLGALRFALVPSLNPGPDSGSRINPSGDARGARVPSAGPACQATTVSMKAFWWGPRSGLAAARAGTARCPVAMELATLFLSCSLFLKQPRVEPLSLTISGTRAAWTAGRTACRRGDVTRTPPATAWCALQRPC